MREKYEGKFPGPEPRTPEVVTINVIQDVAAKQNRSRAENVNFRSE